MSSKVDNRIRVTIAQFYCAMAQHENHLKCFHDYGVQVEGWLKGEFLTFLEDEKKSGRIIDFDREVKSLDGRKKVDFRIEIPSEADNTCVWLELKHWLIGKQKGVNYYASFYFGDPSAIGIISDVKKLAKVPDEGRYLLVLATANPGQDEWQKGVSKFNKKFTPFFLEPLTYPRDFPDYYFLGLIKVSCDRSS